MTFASSDINEIRPKILSIRIRNHRNHLTYFFRIFKKKKAGPSNYIGL